MQAGGAMGLYKKAAAFMLFALLALLWIGEAGGQEGADTEASSSADRRVFMLDVDGAIGPATRDFVTRSLAAAARRDAALVVIRMDTPGGLDASTRDIIKAILNSPVPVATWVAPDGARACRSPARVAG